MEGGPERLPSSWQAGFRHPPKSYPLERAVNRCERVADRARFSTRRNETAGSDGRRNTPAVKTDRFLPLETGHDGKQEPLAMLSCADSLAPVGLILTDQITSLLRHRGY